MAIKPYAAILTAALAVPAESSADYLGKVTAVVDGDTFTMQTENGKSVSGFAASMRRSVDSPVTAKPLASCQTRLREHSSLDFLQLVLRRALSRHGADGRPCVQIVTGDVRKMHQEPEYAGALFQVASQFNALEMVGPSVTPEDGVTRYEHDRTQGPACALAAGAATIYRNYFVPVGNQIGQTAARQLDGLADIGAELSVRLRCPSLISGTSATVMRSAPAKACT